MENKKDVKTEKKNKQTANSQSFGDGNIATLKKDNIDKFDELETYKNLRKKRKKKAWLRALVWIAVLIFTPFIVFFSLIIIAPNSSASFFGYTFYIVETESMIPVLNVHDGVIVKRISSRDELQIGTDISFIRKSDGKTVTHRIVNTIVNHDGEIEYITKGVHTTNADQDPVAFENIIGKKVAVLPVLGHILAFFRTPIGVVIFIAFFILIIFGIVLSFRYSKDIRAVGN